MNPGFLCTHSIVTPTAPASCEMIMLDFLYKYLELSRTESPVCNTYAPGIEPGNVATGKSLNCHMTTRDIEPSCSRLYTLEFLNAIL